MTGIGESDPPALEYIFHPRAIAIAGVSAREIAGFGGWNFAKSLLDIGFAGPLHLIHPTATAIRGLACYPSLRDIPGEVDYVISSVAARNVPALIDDCIAVGTVRVLHLFTAGFSETGDPAQAALERELVGRATAAGIRVIGPNCMGIYSPESRLAFYPNQPVEPGNVGMISQSGFNCAEFMRYAAPRGLRASRVISFGNGADLKAADFFDYFAVDPNTEIITAYIEGIQDGPRFAAALRRAGHAKPTVVLKGGRTEEGSRAANSHTASLAGSLAIFDGLCRQAGAIRVESMEELVDMAVTFRCVGHVRGRQVAVAGAGGGASVIAADDIGAAGLGLAAFEPSTEEALAKITQSAGTSVRNPVDSMQMGTDAGFEGTLMACALDPGVDLVLYHTGFGGIAPGRRYDQRAQMQRQVDILARVREQSGKPAIVAIRASTEAAGFEQGVEFQELCVRAGIAAYPGVPRAALAIARLLTWQRLRD